MTSRLTETSDVTAVDVVVTVAMSVVDVLL